MFAARWDLRSHRNSAQGQKKQQGCTSRRQHFIFSGFIFVKKKKNNIKKCIVETSLFSEEEQHFK